MVKSYSAATRRARRKSAPKALGFPAPFPFLAQTLPDLAGGFWFSGQTFPFSGQSFPAPAQSFHLSAQSSPSLARSFHLTAPSFHLWGPSFHFTGQRFPKWGRTHGNFARGFPFPATRCAAGQPAPPVPVG